MGHYFRLWGPVLAREPFITSWEWVGYLYQILEQSTSSDPITNVDKWFWGNEWIMSASLMKIFHQLNQGQVLAGELVRQIMSYGFSYKIKCVSVGE